MKIRSFSAFFMTLAFVVAIAASASQSRADALTTFDSGADGWVGPQGIGGATFIDSAAGNPAPSLRTQFTDFGIEFTTQTNSAFLGDYTQAPSVTLRIDVNTRLLSFFGLPAPRDLMVDLRDFDNPEPGYPWTSVNYILGTLDESKPGWHSWSVTIPDTSSTTLPAGWGGYGAEDPNTFEPILPPGRTFTSVLSSVDEIAFSTLIPGFFFGFTDFDVAVDNIGITYTPEPTTAALLALGALLLKRKR